MALKDRIARDRYRVYMNEGHFADQHTWNGRTFTCVTDDTVALKRKNNNVNDLSWDNNTMETMVYVPEESLPDTHAPVPNEHIYFDGVLMKVLQVQNDMGMLGILLTVNSPKAVAAE